MKTFYLFRHGATYYSENKVPYGKNNQTATVLPEKKFVIEKLATFLKDKPVDLALRSEFLRCIQTAEIIEEATSFHFEAEPLLNEFIENDFEKFHERMSALTKKLQKLPKNSIALCTHGAVIAALRKLLVDEVFEAHDLMYYPKTGVILELKGKETTSFDFN